MHVSIGIYYFSSHDGSASLQGKLCFPKDSYNETSGVNWTEAHKINRAILRVQLDWTTSLRQQYQLLPLQNDHITLIWLKNNLRSQFRDILSSFV